MKAGDVITEDCIRCIRCVRPGYGLPPKYLDRVIGKVVPFAASVNTPVTEDVLK
ncbi:hypothetical protein [Vreelandella rituensis]|uniref:hypothetical protein n=1 Tax=Vreelandella rituensis TaxID=2282306 RepID=UPI001F1810DD|nr:hypothetical protein [Halomonas rituensis]